MALPQMAVVEGENLNDSLWQVVSLPSGIEYFLTDTLVPGDRSSNTNILIWKQTIETMKQNLYRSLRSIALAIILIGNMPIFAQRHDVLLNDNWKFKLAYNVERGGQIRVNLPHTWNAQDALAGKTDYHRGVGNYERNIFIRPEWKGKRLFLRFEGVNNVANVFVNRRFLGEHRGGYGAFIFEITDQVNYGKDNSIQVKVNNEEQFDVMPLVGDFNFYGGIYRDVHLLVTDETCISPLDYASSGVYLIQDRVSRTHADVRALIQLSNGNSTQQEVTLKLRLLDGKQVITGKEQTLTLAGKESQRQELALALDNPRLWNGLRDPFMYQVEVALYKDGKQVDCVTQHLGLRFFHTDPDKGFFLNGEHLQLRGVCRHQDRSEIGNALRNEHHDEDAALIKEMGANAVRLAHYPQATYFYDLMDKYGLVIWAEIPFVGPGGYDGKGFIDSPAFRANGKEQLKELIRQHYNHPSICMWGLFNELTESGDNPTAYVGELNDLAHREDPTRPTVAASNQNGKFNFVTDAMAWNRYDGWYGGTPDDLGEWLDKKHELYPELRIAVSEYGAGASLYHQQDTLIETEATSTWHPENWQTYYHIKNWQIFSTRPFVWGTFVWNMFDFGAAHRTEGDRPGINDKGLVSFNRKVRKDAFYFYKANWNKEERVLYLADRRNTLRHQAKQTILAFSNEPEAELFVNNKSYGKAKADQYAIMKWENVTLQPGKNEIKVIAGKKGNVISDSYYCQLAVE